jgi:hypothetical protein
LILLETSFWFEPWDPLARRRLLASYSLADSERIAGERLARGEGRRQTYRDDLLAERDVADDDDRALRRALRELQARDDLATLQL